MPKAMWNGIVLAESDDTVVEGNHYFPGERLNKKYFSDSSARSVCPWKGLANYFDVVVDGHTNSGAAWVLRQPEPGRGGYQGPRSVLERRPSRGLKRVVTFDSWRAVRARSLAAGGSRPCVSLATSLGPTSGTT